MNIFVSIKCTKSGDNICTNGNNDYKQKVRHKKTIKTRNKKQTRNKNKEEMKK